MKVMWLNITVPGQVTNFLREVTSNSIKLIWSAPERPNGIIIQYEVTYRLNSSALVKINTTDLRTDFTIRPLPQGTVVSNISVGAYTRVGKGELAYLEPVTIASGFCK